MTFHQIKMIIIGVLVLILSVFVYFIAISPMVNVWEQGLKGEAELKRAEWNRQITVREAEAKFQSAKMLADAEVERAKGVAEANRIIGDSLKDNEQYLRYLWIHNLEEGKGNQVIYVPTEAGLPILEAGKRIEQPKK
jgi:regulator of protease activity HflC (stomatin/prohibitin superfamily)